MGHAVAPHFAIAPLLVGEAPRTICSMKTTSVGDSACGLFREFLQRELARRCADNPQYSLRAFARSLRTDHSTLSQILRAKRRLTAETIRALASELQVSAADIEAFVAREAQLTVDNTWDRHARQLQEEAMEVIAQWQHFAILELVRLDCFRPDCRWIARVLDITVDEVNLSLTRLLHLGLLHMVNHQTWLDVSEHARAQFGQLPAAIAAELLNRIGRVANSRGTNPILSSSTLAVDRKRIAIVASYLEKVRCEIAGMVAGDGTRDDVYQFDILFYPLTTLHQEYHHGTARDELSDSGPEPRPGGPVL